MNDFWKSILKSDKRKAFPILSFPCVSLLGITVRELISDSKLQAEGMKAVADKTDAAASVSFMDLSVEAECFGARVFVSEDEVPTVKGRIVQDFSDAEKLAVPSVGSGRTQIYMDAVKKASELITDRPVFAGMIGPFSLAARLLDVTEIMMDCYDEPEMVHLVLDKATDFLMAYAKAYKETGISGIVMAEPVAGILSPVLEEEFSGPYVKKLIDEVQDDSFAVVYHNCGDNTLHMTESIFSTGAAAYHFGNVIDLEEMLKKAPDDAVVMGNVDPALLRMGTPEEVRKQTLSVLEKCETYPGFVLSTGCDVPPMTPWANIDAFFSAMEEFYGK